MMDIAGVDGCRAGWLAVIEDGSSRIFSTFAELIAGLDAGTIAIDIPIGLTDAGPRECDLAARRILGPKRGSSVFPAPIRPALAAASYAEACAISRRVHGKALSAQGWGICRKIAEVDAALRARPELRERVVEVHPEVSFAQWNGAPIVEGKKSLAGAARRRALVASHFGPEAFETVRRRYLRKEAASDDILDAFAALRTAERIARGEAVTIPTHPPSDSAGLPMRIVY